MRQSLEQLLQSAIVLQYSLSTNVAGMQIPHSHISTTNNDYLNKLI